MEVEVTRITKKEESSYCQLEVWGKINNKKENKKAPLFYMFGRQDEPYFLHNIAYAVLIAEDVCIQCTKHPATINWAAEGGVLAFTHGHYARWCVCCATEAQIKYCSEAADRLPKLITKGTKSCKEQTMEEEITKGEKREKKQQKRRKWKTDGASVRLLQEQIIKKSQAAAKEGDSIASKDK